MSGFAADGTWGYSGDGGPATSAQLSNPLTVAFDGARNMYIGDYTAIRKVDLAGIISTVAGGGVGGYGGDGGPATQALIGHVAGMAIDGNGNINFADALTWRVRKVDGSGVISTIAGTGIPGYSGDGGPASEATLNLPYGVVLDGADLIVTATVTWHVAYAFSGFFEPVATPPARTRANAGRSFPVKFGLGGDRGLNVLAAGWPRAVATSCSSTAAVDLSGATTPPPPGPLSYDAASQTDTYLWTTDKAWAGTCRQLTIRLADGTDHVVQFDMR